MRALRASLANLSLMPIVIDYIPVNSAALRTIRLLRRLSGPALARAADGQISAAYLSELENGHKCTLSREKAHVIADALGLDSPKAITTRPELFDEIELQQVAV